jgi:hypothetical protein
MELELTVTWKPVGVVVLVGLAESQAEPDVTCSV